MEACFSAESEQAFGAMTELSSRWIGDLNDCQLRESKETSSTTTRANFSVPGAGKTRVTLALYEACRASNQVNKYARRLPQKQPWRLDERTRFMFFVQPLPRIAVMDGRALPPAEIVLVNYERLPDGRGAMINWLRSRVAMIVLDEAHRMKLGRAGAWGAVVWLSDHTRQRG